MLFKTHLLYFGASAQTPTLPVIGQCDQTSLTISFDISSFRPLPAWPRKAQTYLAEEAQRRDYLWEETCFEVFIQVKNATAYHEINATPTGFWNVYRFDDYRQPAIMPPQRESAPLLQRIMVTPNSIALVLDTQPCFAHINQLKLGLCAVLPSTNSLSYWALKHSQPYADFHYTKDWMLTLN